MKVCSELYTTSKQYCWTRYEIIMGIKHVRVIEVQYLEGNLARVAELADIDFEWWS